VVRLDRVSVLGFRALPADTGRWPEPLRGCAARYPNLAALRQAQAQERLPRALHACLIDELARRGAAAIAFDIGFAEVAEREPGTADLARSIRAHGGVVLLETVERRPVDEASARQGLPSAMADVLTPPHRLLRAAAAGTAPFMLPMAAAEVRQFWSRHDGAVDPAQMPARAVEVRSLPALEIWAGRAGLAPPAGLLDRDAHRRWLVSAWLLAAGEPPPAELTRPERDLLLALRRIAAGPPQHYLDFFGPPGSVPSVAIYDLLTGARGPDLAGRAVFVGVQELTLLDSRDHFPTAFRSEAGVELSGVEIAATAYHNLLHDQALRSLPEAARLALVLGLAVAMAAAACHGTVWRGLLLALGLAAAYGLAAWAAFAQSGLWLPVAVPLGVLLLVLLVGPLMHYLGAVRLFQLYVPRAVTRHALRGSLYAEAQSRQEVTIMFTDIVGFSTLAERQPPEAVAGFLNRHYTLLVSEIERQGGVVAQFIGDSVLAYWGAPDPMIDHAVRAARAALAIAAALERDNAWRGLRGEPAVRLRIGINTGTISAGTVGGAGRSTYAVTGDAVNAAQRIEQLGKSLCPDRPTTAILLGEATAERLDNRFHLEPVGRQALRGRARAEAVFRLRPARTAGEAGQSHPALAPAQ
jgi:adenylate cyclase